MSRDQLVELHYITPIANISSILERGILSHQRAARILHETVALEEVQERRDRRAVPRGRPLHHYVNLYMCARNPMMYRRKEFHAQLCVLRIGTRVLDWPGVIITDRNAARGIARFLPSPSGLGAVDHALVFAEDWRHPGDLIALDNHRGIKCAEVLVPDVIDSSQIVGAYASCSQSASALRRLAPDLEVTVNSHIFFADV
jgi:ssDNA thymidine ADP-ribosyltransferase, DarT